MSVFTMVAIIVTVSVMGGVFSSWLKSKEKSEKNGKHTEEVNERIKALEERIKVLERLATDRTHRLREEIDAL